MVMDTKTKGWCFLFIACMAIVTWITVWSSSLSLLPYRLYRSSSGWSEITRGECGQQDARNLARLSSTYDPSTQNIIASTDIDKFHVVTNFFVVTHPAFNSDLDDLDEDSEEYSDEMEKLKLRLSELTRTLQLNLNHERVAMVHVIYSHPYVSHFLSHLNLHHSERLVLHLVQGQPTYQHAFSYAYTNLPNRLIAVTNQDIFLGEGWQLINSSLLLDRRVMYALTRYRGNTSCPDPFTCEYSQSYVGSHDTFAFYAHSNTNVSLLEDMNLKSDSLGIENVLIWVYRYKLNYLVLNACRILKTYHLHCSNVHNRQRLRVNNQMTTALASFTSRLY